MNNLNCAIVTLGFALVGTSAAAQAASNPFAAQELSSGYSVAAAEKAKDGSCGEAKCGAEMKAGEHATKAGEEGKCGADKAVKEGSCGEEGKAMKEGSCGEKKAE
ncbi:MAG: HvfA family oxazolone/thioamide-modified RiPP metallophore [Pseudomonas sp.]